MARQNDFSFEFTEKEGFQVAFAVIDYRNANTDFSDYQGRNMADYLNITAYLFESNVEVGKGDITELETHVCTESELGLDGKGKS